MEIVDKYLETDLIPDFQAMGMSDLEKQVWGGCRWRDGVGWVVAAPVATEKGNW